MEQEKATPVWTLRTVAIYIVACTLIAVVCGFAMAYLYGSYRGDPPVLNEFALTYRMPSGNLHTILEAAIRHEGRPHIQKSITTVNYADRTRFLNMLTYVAPTHGWYVHSSADDRTRIILTIPATDLHIIDTMVENPIDWITQSMSANRSVSEPSRTDNLINVSVRMRNPTTVNDLAFGGMIIVAMFGLTALGIGVVVIITAGEDLANQRRATRQSKLDAA